MSFHINSKFTTVLSIFFCSIRTTGPTHRNHFDSAVSATMMHFVKRFVSITFLLCSFSCPHSQSRATDIPAVDRPHLLKLLRMRRVESLHVSM